MKQVNADLFKIEARECAQRRAKGEIVIPGAYDRKFGVTAMFLRLSVAE